MLKLPPNRIGQIIQKVLFRLLDSLDDRTFLSAYYYALRARNANILNNPQRLCDIINWMKINYRIPILHQIVDKYEVRRFVESKVGKRYLNQVYFVSDKFNRYLFSKLPDNYILKSTHGSTMNLLCRNSSFNYAFLQNITEQWLKTDYYKTRREWAYKGIPRRIMCEKLLQHRDGRIPEDIKVMCFRGKPEFIQVDFDRFGKHTRNLYDTNWTLMPFTFKCDTLLSNNTHGMSKPGNLDEILEVAQELSKEFLFSRIDLYNIDQKRIVFGEITIYPGGGSGSLSPEKFDYIYGSKLNLKLS